MMRDSKPAGVRRTVPRGKRRGLRRRDVLLFVGCLAGLLLSFQSDGSATFTPGFVTMWGEDMAYEMVTQLPKPHVTDVDGDGVNDIVATTSPEMVVVLSNYRPARAAGGYVQELIPRYSARTSSIIIGLAVGPLTKNEKKIVPVVLLKKPKEGPRTQAIVAVTDDYIVTMYNNELKEQWAVRLPVPEARNSYMYDEINDAEDLYGWFVPSRATVMILPHDIYSDDKGMVVVGIEVELPMNNDEDEDENIGSATRQMSYFALNGADGALRWTHNSTDQIRASQETGLRAAHNYKLTVQHLEQHTTDQDWRYFRNNIIAGLPHVVTHQHDVHMQLHRFAPHKNRKTRSAHETPAPLKYKTKDRSRSQNDYGMLGEKVRSMLQFRKHRESMPAPNVLVIHREDGIEALHLYTGKSITQFGPLEKNILYEDVNDDAQIDAVRSEITDLRSLDTYSNDWSKQRVVCDGVVHSGVPVGHTKLFNHSICVEGGLLHSFEFLRSIMKADEEESGMLTNALGGVEIPGFGGRDHFDELLSAAAPISLHRNVHRLDRTAIYRTDVVFFISSGLVTCIDGKTGKLRWHSDTDALFGAHASPDTIAKMTARAAHEGTALNAKHRVKLDDVEDSFAHLKLYSLHTRTEPEPQEDVVTIRNIYNVYPAEYILAVGNKKIAVLNAHTGHFEHEIELEAPPAAPVVIADMNGDGVNDVLVMTTKGIHGFLGRSRRGANVITATITCVLALLGLLFLTHSSVQQGPGGKVRRVPRSTD